MGDESEAYDIVLTGGAPWGFRLQGGREFRSPLQVSKVTGGGKAHKAGLRELDNLVAINGVDCENCIHNDALNRVKAAVGTLTLSIKRGPAARRSSGVFDDKPVARTVSPSNKGPVPSPFSRGGAYAGRGSSSSETSSDAGVRTGSTSSSAEPTQGRTASTSSSHRVSVSPNPPAATTSSSQPSNTAASSGSVASGKRVASTSTSSESSTTDGPTTRSASVSTPTDLQTGAGPGTKDKGWYKEMFKTMHAAGSTPDSGPLTSPTTPTYKYESRKSLPVASDVGKNAPKWTSSRHSSTTTANFATSAKAYDDRRSSVPVSSSSSTSNSVSTRRMSREPPPSVSARADFFRKKEVASKDSGLSPAGSRSMKGGAVSPAPTWSQRQAAAQASSTAPAGKAERPPTKPKSSTLPRSSTSDSKRSTPSPSLTTPDKRTPSPSMTSPKPAEGYNTLNAALSDLNDAISSLEVATTTAAQKEGKKKTPWQPREAKDATVLQSQSSDHQNRMEGVLEKKISVSGLPPAHKPEPAPVFEPKRMPEPAPFTQPKRSPEPVVQPKRSPEPVVQPKRSPEPVVQPKRSPEPVVQSKPAPEPVVPVETKGPSPRPASPPKKSVAPATQSQPSTRVSEPEVQMQLLPPVEAFVIELPPTEPELLPEPIAAEPERPFHETKSKPEGVHSKPSIEMERAVAVTKEPPVNSMEDDLEALLGLDKNMQPLEAAPDTAISEPSAKRVPPDNDAINALLGLDEIGNVVDHQLEPEPPVDHTQKPIVEVKDPAPAASQTLTEREAPETATPDGPVAPVADHMTLPDLEPGQGFGVALYSFTPQGKREIPLRKGDEILLTRKVDSNWLEGIVDGIKGIFPKTYVKTLIAPTAVVQRNNSPATKTPEPTAEISAATPTSSQELGTDGATSPSFQQVQVREKSEGKQGRARARYSFQAENTRELSLSKGAELVLTRRIDKNWYEGTIGHGVKGIVPSSYLEILEDVPVMNKRLSASQLDGKKSPPGRPAEGPKKPTSPAPPPPTAAAASPSPVNLAPVSPAAVSPAPGSPAPGSPVASPIEMQGDRFRAVYAYAPQNEDELELQEGDTIFVVEQCTDGWFVGTSERTKGFGTFPGNYVTAAS